MTTATVPLTFGAVREPTPRYEPTSEGAVARLWRNAHTLAEGLVTEDGRRLHVVYPGRPNGGPGPDFRDALLATEAGSLLSGDVELHLRARDWYGHGHHIDARYNGVILHVVLHANGEAASSQQSRMSAPIASLESAVDRLELNSGPNGTGLAWWDPLDRESKEAVLDRAGDQRFYARSRGFALELATADAEQVLYEAIFEALGYSANRRPFRELARAVPISAVASLRSEPRSTRLTAVRALLLNAAGLLRRAEAREESHALKRVLRLLPKTEKMPPARWRMSAMRPANRPARRIEGAAFLVHRFLDSGFCRGLGEAVSTGDASELTRALTARPFIGVGRARDIAVNVALSFLYGFGGLRRDARLKNGCVELYKAYPKLAENEITREVSALLGLDEGGVRIAGARRQQGLIHLYKTMLFCPRPDEPQGR